ncbi:IPT/TIG domain-containing protein [Engelhardtia mirabilis]|uniref:IPT/TIG domain-containing protein n=1 Tax=Engelhardtia mirabilis TaxID=2528011 RepID=A0A518BJ68_9BACT|nr:hypothetical protein Pla133_20970 [Planctomycetes bacterium Pla133]QDV01347.1 hypothetical protein Pla86_20970 [Planctomycetes bacterium Pla86]
MHLSPSRWVPPVLVLLVCPPALGQGPTVTSVEPTLAATPQTIVVTGSGFGPETTVTIGGQPATVTQAGSNSLHVLPAPSDPGFADVVVSAPGGTVVASGAAQMWPTLTASNTGLGGTASIEIAIGDAGTYDLAFAMASLDEPLSLGPEIAYGLLLDPAGPLVLLASGLAPNLAPSQLSFPVPAGPELLGVELPLQALTRRGLIEPTSFSLTNLAVLSFDSVAYGPPTNIVYAANPVTYQLGQPVAPNVPAVDGYVESWGIAPLPQFGFYPLPEGLFLDSTNGNIVGTPTKIQGPKNHLVVAVNAAGSTSTALKVSVDGAAPQLLGYSTDPAVYDFGAVIEPNLPSVQGYVADWAIEPELPAGLEFSAGAITGAALEGSLPQLYTVTASNEVGSDSTTVSIAVTGSLKLTDISVPKGATWQINRPIDFDFSAPIDLATVNSNTLSIKTTSGLSALGTFSVDPSRPSRVRFQPFCPGSGEPLGYGLMPGGVSYQITAFGLKSGPTTIQSVDGQSLGATTSVSFQTPLGTSPTEVFFDTQAGPPAPLVGGPGGTAGPVTALLVAGVEQPFELDLAGQAISIVDVPLNFFSDLAAQVSVLLRFDQPISPSAGNLAPSMVGIERSTGGGQWDSIPTEAQLLSNCVEGGAVVALKPLGVLPPATDLRVRIGAGFEDLTGEGTRSPSANFALLRTIDPSDPAFTPPGDLADEIFESFNVGGAQASSFEGPPDPLIPAAVWADGLLTAAVSFEGTGGPGGDFDWQVPDGTVQVLSTDSSTIVGGPGFVPTAVQNVVDGVVNVRNLRIGEGATLRVIGPNPAKILASGNVEILGRIDVSGLDALPVSQPFSPNIPSPGAGTVAGSGRGGSGSPLTAAPSPSGGAGFGAFQVPGKGGSGGEAGYSPSNSFESNRGGGGGGGRFAADSSTPPDDHFNALIGGPGAPSATGALTGLMPPQPGANGPSVFVDGDPSNDFWGLLYEPGDPADPADDLIVIGELPQPWAGAGGGGGGDSIKASSWPPPTLVPSDNKRAAGGGSGGGQLQLQVLGDIVLGAQAQLVANGGDGAEGESTSGTNQVGGAGGGGSGGHLILQALGRLDLSATTGVVLEAIGGQGGIGKGDGDNDPPDVAQSSGGDGGAGVIQVHLPDFAEFDPQSGAGHVILPSPGGDVAAAIAGISAPNAWQLYPSFSQRSRARSIPIALGAGIDNPLSAALQPLFDFDGTVADSAAPDAGQVQTLLDQVASLPSILSGQPLSVDPVARTVVVDATALLTDASGPFSKDVYLRNPQLLRQFELELVSGFTELSFTVASADFDASDSNLTLHLDQSGGPLSSFGGRGTSFELVPRYFRVRNDGLQDVLAAPASIMIRFQGLAADSGGLPRLDNPLVPWTSDVSKFNDPGMPAPIEFVQFEVTFDLGPSGNSASPLLSLEFIRLPFRF